MRFRLIEKDTVGTSTEFEQAAKKKLAHSKTYIGSKAKLAVDMNKIKNTKIGDDIHYYINGVEGRGIVVKMANEYLEVFKENGQLGTIHINDTFFVKDILVNKQWNDMDDQERYEALNKIHAPTPRFIMKVWEDLPEEIKILLQKSSKTINKVGSTYEEGESKESETKDHARTGFAQNEQFSKKKPKPCKCGDPKCKDPKCKEGKDIKKTDTEGKIKDRERKYGWASGRYTGSGERKQSQAAKDKEALGKNPLGSDADLMQKERERKEAEAAAKRAADKPKEEEKPKVSDKEQARLDKPDSSGDYTVGGKRITNWDKKYGKYSKKKALYKSWLEAITKPAALPKGTKKNPNLFYSLGEDEDKHLTSNQKKQYHQEVREWGEDHPHSEEALDIIGRIGSGGKEGVKGDQKRIVQIDRDEIEREKKRKETGSQPANPKKKAETYEERATQKAFDVWLERRDKAGYVTKPAPTGTGGTASNLPSGKKEQTENEKDDDLQTRAGQSSDTRVATTVSDMYAADAKRGERKQPPQSGQTPEHYEPKSPPKDMYKSDVEHGVYGNVAGSDGVGVSTDTKVDVAEDTGYEERPHISVEEAGKLPRTTFNPHGKDELHVSGDGSKDKPKFSQPSNQEQPVRKAGLPQQHPNTYGMKYGMKGGVKKVWCPEHQMWEETRKDWHEDK